ncbi:MAG: DUF1002 domain-containing protein [Blautia sp.]|nr:DUF1002 domain-containing protein [Blautia sp.]
MRKKKGLQSILLSLLLAVGSLFPALPARADAMRVVTLGADLSQEQQNRMLTYFNVNPNEVRIIYVTIQDEINHLASYVPMEQIGSRTVSCAYVRPTTSGGIKVKTANLNWVTGNMIAASLSTSGVKNCEVIAACPFEVSGTGALTGVQMAYEVAVGKRLDEKKKEISVEEIVVTGNVADSVGQDAATYLINRAKIEVFRDGLMSYDEIYDCLQRICLNNGLYLPEDQIVDITMLLVDMVEEKYDLDDDLLDTLTMVIGNVADAVDIPEDDDFLEEIQVEGGNIVNEIPDETVDPDNILEDLDESVLGDDVVISSTEEIIAEPADDDLEGWDVFDGDVSDIGNITDAPDSSWEDDTWGDASLDGADGFFDDDLSGDSMVGDLMDSDFTDDWASDTAVDEIGADFADDTGSDLVDAGSDFGDDIASDLVDEMDGDLVDETGSDFAVDEFTDIDEIDIDDSGSQQNDKEDFAETDAEFHEDSAEKGGSVEAEDLDLTSLSSIDTEYYNRALKFCRGEFEGDKAALAQSIDSYSPMVSYVLDQETGHKLTNKLMKEYLRILNTDDSVLGASISDTYLSSKLNAVDRLLKKMFSIQGEQDAETTDILFSVSLDNQELLYLDTIAFFEQLYGEYNGSSVDSTASDFDIDEIETDMGQKESATDSSWDTSTDASWDTTSQTSDKTQSIEEVGDSWDMNDSWDTNVDDSWDTGADDSWDSSAVDEITDIDW